jgi:hypothetical protein
MNTFSGTAGFVRTEMCDGRSLGGPPILPRSIEPSEEVVSESVDASTAAGGAGASAGLTG